MSRAEILVCCAGRPGLVKGAWIKPGAVVIDVAMNVPRTASFFTFPYLYTYIYIYISR